MRSIEVSEDVICIAHCWGSWQSLTVFLLQLSDAVHPLSQKWKRPFRVHFREGSHLEDLSMLFPPVKKAATSDWASKSCRCLPKGGTWRAAAEVLVCSESISHLYCSGQVLGSDSGGRNWDHCLKRLRLSVEMQEIILEEAEWRSSTGAKLGWEGERKNKESHSPQSPESPGWWANTIYSFFPSRYTDTPVSALLVWVSLWVSTWWSFCFKESLGKSSRKAVLKEHSSSCQVESSQPFV